MLLPLVVITHSRFQHRPQEQNDRASDDRESTPRRAETRAHKFLPRVHSAAQTDNPRVGAQDQEAVPESDKACPALRLGRAPNAANRACRDCRAAEKVRRWTPARKSFRRTSR